MGNAKHRARRAAELVLPALGSLERIIEVFRCILHCSKSRPLSLCSVHPRQNRLYSRAPHHKAARGPDRESRLCRGAQLGRAWQWAWQWAWQLWPSWERTGTVGSTALATPDRTLEYRLTLEQRCTLPYLDPPADHGGLLPSHPHHRHLILLSALCRFV